MFANLVLTLLIFISASYVDACCDQPAEKQDAVACKEAKDECYRLIRNVHQNLHIWEWPDSFVKNILKESLEDYLMVYLNTPESRQLFAKYESADWNVHEMMKMHLEDKE